MHSVLYENSGKQHVIERKFVVKISLFFKKKLSTYKCFAI